MVIAPLEATLTTPLSVASDVDPLESKVDTEVSPITSNVLAKLEAPVTSNVPAVATLPDVSATVNLFVSIDKPPFSAVAPETVNELSVEEPELIVPVVEIFSSPKLIAPLESVIEPLAKVRLPIVEPVAALNVPVTAVLPVTPNVGSKVTA